VSIVVTLLHSLRFLVRSRAVLHIETPWHNAYVERVIGSIRRECLDHVIVLNATGLHRALADYVAYYMRSRTHLALGKDTPNPRSVTPPSAGRIVAIPEVGGLHHRYDRIAA
jgi:putative transposase